MSWVWHITTPIFSQSIKDVVESFAPSSEGLLFWNYHVWELACHWHSPSAAGIKKHKADPWHMSGYLHCVWGLWRSKSTWKEYPTWGNVSLSRNLIEMMFSCKKTSHKSNVKSFKWSTWFQDCKGDWLMQACRATESPWVCHVRGGTWESTNQNFELSGWVPLHISFCCYDQATIETSYSTRHTTFHHTDAHRRWEVRLLKIGPQQPTFVYLVNTCKKFDFF